MKRPPTRPPTALHLATRPLPLSPRSLCRFLASLPTHHRSATMPPRRRGVSGYCGVRTRPCGALSAEIRSGDMRLGLGTFDTAHEAARAYDMAAWRLRQSRTDMSFPEDVINEQQFFTQRRAERATYREDRRTQKAAAQFNIELGAASSWDSEDDRYCDAFIKTSEEDITEAESESEEDDEE
nr:ethylene-responsive transcription factor RAP2-2-like [Aegilops tauschii subsp. strangulata]